MLQAEQSSIDLSVGCGRVRWDGEIIVDGAGTLRRKGRRQGKRREAGGFQERDDMSNLLAHHTQDHQAKKLIDVSLGLPLVEPESWAAIGARRKQMPKACSSEERSLEQRGDGSPSLEPGRKRRHGEPRVLSQQRHESRDVRLLPQGQIALK